MFRGSKYVAWIEPFKVLYRTFSSKRVKLNISSLEFYRVLLELVCPWL